MKYLWIAAALGTLVFSSDILAQEGGEGGRPGGRPQGGRGGMDPAAMMERLDKNKDGKITEEEAGRAWQRISAADKDKDGNVTAEELKAMPQQRGQRGGRGNMDPAAQMESLDKDKDGKLTKEEVGNDRLWQRMVAADKDKDGKITLEELKAMPRPQRGGRGEGNGDAPGDAPRGRGGRGRPSTDEPKPDAPKPGAPKTEPKPAGGGGQPKPVGGTGGGGN